VTLGKNALRFGLLALLVGTLAACASDPSKQAATKRPTRDDPSKGIVCTTEIPTGSLLKEKKCTTPEERELARRDAEHRMVVQSGSATGP
jgi:hypothetical protein